MNRLNYDDVETVKGLFNSICGVNLFIHQRSRELAGQNNMNETIYDNDMENTEIILKYEQYKENQDEELRPYEARDAIVGSMYDEIQNTYQKTLGEVVAATEINNKKI